MALIDQQDKGKKEKSEESFITNLINRCLLLTQLLQSYIIPTSIQYSNFIGQIALMSCTYLAWN